jgi:hypothetical protein
MKRRSGVGLAALIVVVGCSPVPEPTVSPSPSPAPTPTPPAATLTVIGRGTFECGHAFHGCTAWFVVRPRGWKQPERWNPGLVDADDQPGTGTVTTTIQCTADLTVSPGTQRVAVSAAMGPTCRIDVKLDPSP